MTLKVVPLSGGRGNLGLEAKNQAFCNGTDKASL